MQFLLCPVCCYRPQHLSCKLNMFYIHQTLHLNTWTSFIQLIRYQTFQREHAAVQQNNSLQFVKCSLKTYIVYLILYLNNSSNCFQLNSILLKCLMENLHKIFPISSSSSIKEIIDPIYSKLSCQRRPGGNGRKVEARIF